MRTETIRFASVSTGFYVDILSNLLKKVEEQYANIGKNRHSDRIYHIKNPGEDTGHNRFRLILNENIIATNEVVLKKQYKAVLMIYADDGPHAKEVREVIDFIKKLGICFAEPEPSVIDFFDAFPAKHLFALVPVQELKAGKSFLNRRHLRIIP